MFLCCGFFAFYLLFCSLNHLGVTMKTAVLATAVQNKENIKLTCRVLLGRLVAEPAFLRLMNFLQKWSWNYRGGPATWQRSGLPYSDPQ